MYCPECGNENKDGAVFCKKCGRKLNRVKLVEKNQEIEKICLNCGVVNKNSNSYCKNCESSLNEPLQRANDADRHQNYPHNKIKLKAVLIGLLMGIISLVILKGSLFSYVIAPIVGGFVAAYLGGGSCSNSIKYGVINGAVLDIIAGFFSEAFRVNTNLIGIYFQYRIFSPLSPSIIASSILSGLMVLVFFAVVGIIFGILGGIIGNPFNNRFGLKSKFNLR
ncbi:MAG TPA: zinc ribbon domain-containing protein, partial [Methanobacterium sp.]|nr:zinc ribbon domain-containing protein [Methanobacterium sp.]